MAMHRILIPLDGSDFSRQILPHVREFFGPVDNELVLLRVAPHPSGNIGLPPRPYSPDVGVPTFESERDLVLATHPVFASQELDTVRAAILDELQVEALPLENAGYTISTYARFGEPAHEIVAFVETENIHLVAVTTHGRSGLGRLIFGSVAEWVVRHASVPVMVLRPTEQPESDLAA